MNPRADLDRAQRRLNVAFERARAVRYRPNSPEMLELHAAEDSLQQARARHHAQIDPAHPDDQHGRAAQMGGSTACPAERPLAAPRAPEAELGDSGS